MASADCKRSVQCSAILPLPTDQQFKGSKGDQRPCHQEVSKHTLLETLPSSR